MDGRSRSPRKAAPTSAQKTTGRFPLTNKQAEVLLQCEGSLFLELARGSAAKLALVPLAEAGGFQLQACGLQTDVNSTQQLLIEILQGQSQTQEEDEMAEEDFEAGEPEEESSSAQQAVAAQPTWKKRPWEDASWKQGDVGGGGRGGVPPPPPMQEWEEEEELILPCNKTGFVLSRRRPGEKGSGKAAGLTDLSELSGASLWIVQADRDRSGSMVLRARGTRECVTAAKLIIEERLKDWEDAIEDCIQVPKKVFTSFLCGGKHFEIETDTNTVISVSRKDGHAFRITGSPSHVEAAKKVFQELVDGKGKGSGPGKGKESQKDKGKGKDHGKGKDKGKGKDHSNGKDKGKGKTK